MANTIVKDLMLKKGLNPENIEDFKPIFDQALDMNGELRNGAKTAIEQFGEKGKNNGNAKYSWGFRTIVNMTGPVLSNKELNGIAKCVITVLGGNEADFQELRAMNTTLSGLKTAGKGKYTAEQKDEFVQQAYDCRVEKAEDLRRADEERAAKAAAKASAPKRIKKANAETLAELNEGATQTAGAESVDDILDEITG